MVFIGPEHTKLTGASNSFYLQMSRCLSGLSFFVSISGFVQLAQNRKVPRALLTCNRLVLFVLSRPRGIDPKQEMTGGSPVTGTHA
jgi:hypothetical protein